MNVLLLDCISPKLDLETHKAVESLIDGFKSAGANINSIQVNDLDIKPCFSCTSQSSFVFGSKCRCDDDMNTLYPEFRLADIWVFAAHVNTNGSTEYLKNLLDRLEPLFQPILNSSNPDDIDFETVNMNFGKILLISSFDKDASDIAEKISDYVNNMGLLFSKKTGFNILFDERKLDFSQLETIYLTGQNLINNAQN